mgnify:CR=1 FL=1
MNQVSAPPTPTVVRYRDGNTAALTGLLANFGLLIRVIADDQPIPGSFWGDEEAGLLGSIVLVRADTPLHSILHEACHYICMDEVRRARLDTNAGGDYEEENAVCYLQILLAGEIPGLGRDRMMADMDAWGYSFRLGSARAWFERDAADAHAWLQHHGLVSATGKPTFQRRGDDIKAQHMTTREECCS